MKEPSHDPLLGSIPALLGKLDRPGDFFGGGAVELPVCRIAVEGVGDLGLREWRAPNGGGEDYGAIEVVEEEVVAPPTRRGRSTGSPASAPTAPRSSPSSATRWRGGGS